MDERREDVERGNAVRIVAGQRRPRRCSGGTAKVGQSATCADSGDLSGHPTGRLAAVGGPGYLTQSAATTR
jgi:hypothetical protein